MNSKIICALIATFMAAPMAFAKSGNGVTSIEKSAKAALAQKNYDKVIADLNPYTDEISDTSFLDLATAYAEKSDFTNLVRVFTLLAEKRPKDYHVQYMLADAQLKLAQASKELREKDKNERNAIDSYRQAIKINKEFRPAHQALVNFFSKTGLNHEAREQLNEMLEIFGQRGEVHADLCRLYSNDGFIQQAITHCRRAMALSPQFPESYIYLAQTYFDQKELARAEKTLILAARKFPSSEFVQYGAGEFFLKKNNYPVAAKYLKRAVASEIKSGRSQHALAKAQFETGEYKEAIDHYKAACKVIPAAKADFLSAASKLRLKGDRDLASQYTMAAAECRPDK